MQTEYDFYLVGFREAVDKAGSEPMPRWRFDFFYGEFQRVVAKLEASLGGVEVEMTHPKVLGWIAQSPVAAFVESGRKILGIPRPPTINYAEIEFPPELNFVKPPSDPLQKQAPSIVDPGNARFASNEAEQTGPFDPIMLGKAIPFDPILLGSAALPVAKPGPDLSIGFSKVSLSSAEPANSVPFDPISSFRPAAPELPEASALKTDQNIPDAGKKPPVASAEPATSVPFDPISSFSPIARELPEASAAKPDPGPSVAPKKVSRRISKKVSLILGEGLGAPVPFDPISTSPMMQGIPEISEAKKDSDLSTASKKVSKKISLTSNDRTEAGIPFDPISSPMMQSVPEETATKADEQRPSAQKRISSWTAKRISKKISLASGDAPGAGIPFDPISSPMPTMQSISEESVAKVDQERPSAQTRVSLSANNGPASALPFDPISSFNPTMPEIQELPAAKTEPDRPAFAARVSLSGNAGPVSALPFDPISSSNPAMPDLQESLPAKTEPAPSAGPVKRPLSMGEKPAAPAPFDPISSHSPAMPEIQELPVETPEPRQPDRGARVSLTRESPASSIPFDPISSPMPMMADIPEISPTTPEPAVPAAKPENRRDVVDEAASTMASIPTTAFDPIGSYAPIANPATDRRATA